MSPTISGVIVEERDQVLILEPGEALETFFCRESSINGPFFRLRDILISLTLTAADNALCGHLLLPAGLHAKSWLSGRCLWTLLQTDRVTTLSTSMRVVNWVHRLTSDRRTDTAMTCSSGLSPTNQPPIRV